MSTKHRAMEKFDEHRFSTHELVQILRSRRFNGPQPSRKRQPNQRHSEAESTTDDNLSFAGRHTLVLPFFLLFQIPRNPFVYPRDRRSHAGYIVESHNTPKTRLASGRKSRPLFPASFSCRKKKLFPKYDDPETVSPHFLNFAVRKHLPAEQFVDR